MRAYHRLLHLILVLCICIATVPVIAEESDTVEIVFLNTSDLHGQLFASDYSAGVNKSGEYKHGLTRIASYIKEQRAEYDNVFLSDSGDIIQGTPLTYYYSFYQPEIDDPAIKALRVLGYDLFVLSNHEFNYGLEILLRQLDCLTSASRGDEAQVAVSAANYLKESCKANRDWVSWNDYPPYIIREFDGVKIAIMGIGNPNISGWEIPEHLQGIYVADIIETYLHYESEMKAASDIVVLVSHSGIDSHPSYSDFIRALVEQTDSIDLVFAGHEHLNSVTEITNAAGKIVPVVSPGSKANAIGRALVTYNKSTRECQIQSEVLPMDDYAADQKLTDVLAPYEGSIWSDYMLKSIGMADGDFSAEGLTSAPSAFMDLINKVQIWGAYDSTGFNTPNNPDDDVPAQLSIASPLTSGKSKNLIEKGTIKLGDLFRLYRYENWFCHITMSGKEIRAWLEYAASKIAIDDDGKPYLTDKADYFDIVYGDGFSYVIDYSAPKGSRVGSMTYNSLNVKDDDIFTVVINNHRFNSGGGYISYLNSHGCRFCPNDEKRLIYSTRYDMVQGEDLGQARNLLAEYIKQEGVISPTIASDWKLVNGSGT